MINIILKHTLKHEQLIAMLSFSRFFVCFNNYFDGQNLQTTAQKELCLCMQRSAKESMEEMRNGDKIDGKSLLFRRPHVMSGCTLLTALWDHAYLFKPFLSLIYSFRFLSFPEKFTVIYPSASPFFFLVI